MPRPELIGHRGAPRERPENTIGAVLRAIELGADGIEIDVHATRDGVVVVHHDPTIPPGAGEHMGRAIAEMSAAEVTSVRLPGGGEIPTLHDLLAAVDGRAVVYIEIKGDGIERAVVDVARAAQGRFAIHSFDHAMMGRVRRLTTEFPTGVLTEEPVADPGALLREVDARDLWPRWDTIDRRLVDATHAAGGRVIAWTVNGAPAAGALAAMGVDGLCTDVLPELRPIVEAET